MNSKQKLGLIFCGILMALFSCKNNQSGDPIKEIIGDHLSITPYNYSQLVVECKNDREKFINKFAGKEIYAVITFNKQYNEVLIDGELLQGVSVKNANINDLVIADSSRADQKYLSVQQSLNSDFFVITELNQKIPDTLHNSYSAIQKGHTYGYLDNYPNSNDSFYYLIYNKRTGNLIADKLGEMLALYIRMANIRNIELIENTFEKKYLPFHIQHVNESEDKQTIKDDILAGNYVYRKIPISTHKSYKGDIMNKSMQDNINEEANNIFLLNYVIVKGTVDKERVNSRNGFGQDVITFYLKDPKIVHVEYLNDASKFFDNKIEYLDLNAMKKTFDSLFAISLINSIPGKYSFYNRGDTQSYIFSKDSSKNNGAFLGYYEESVNGQKTKITLDSVKVDLNKLTKLNGMVIIFFKKSGSNEINTATISNENFRKVVINTNGDLEIADQQVFVRQK